MRMSMETTSTQPGVPVDNVDENHYTIPIPKKGYPWKDGLF